MPGGQKHGQTARLMLMLMHSQQHLYMVINIVLKEITSCRLNLCAYANGALKRLKTQPHSFKRLVRLFLGINFHLLTFG